MKAAEIVEAMLDVLNSPEVWCKFLLYNTTEDGVQQHCLMGAMNKVMYGNPVTVSHPIDTDALASGMYLVHKMDELAIEKGYQEVWGCLRAPVGTGAHAVLFNNAVETEYEDLRLFLKETLERVS